jgi:hypothetical protein
VCRRGEQLSVRLPGARWLRRFIGCIKDEVGLINNAMPASDSSHALAQSRLPYSPRCTTAPSCSVLARAAPACEAAPASSPPRRLRWPGDGPPRARNRQQTAARAPLASLGSSRRRACSLRVSPTPGRATHFVVPRNWSSTMQPPIVHREEPCPS